MFSFKKKIFKPTLISDQELISWIRLSRSENIGPVSFFQLLNRYGDASTALEAVPEWARRGGRRQVLKICTQDEAEQELEAHHHYGANLISFNDSIYPAILKHIHDAPPLLSIKGNSNHLSKIALGIVGARNASLNGKKLTQVYARELSEQGYSIVSGLARGIDTAAHEGSLSFSTIAVIAGGIDYIYPTENKKLYEQISCQGLLIAESPFGSIPHASHFPRRNRLIAGLSAGVIVVEAALKSGSLITAHCALDYGRDVFAVPGSPLDPRCHGTNHLIRQGATLIQSSHDIIADIQKNKINSYNTSITKSEKMLSVDEKNPDQWDQILNQARPLILENLSFTPVAIDDLIRVCHFPYSVVMTILVELELSGRLNRHFNAQVSLKNDL